MADICAKLRDGSPGASRATLLGNVVAERLSGKPVETFKSAAMQWGNDCEPLARQAYQFDRMTPVEQVGFVDHPKIAYAGASPDGIIRIKKGLVQGLVQFKCPMVKTHIDTLLGAPIDGGYIKQMQWEMACTNAIWCDYCSFDPRLPEPMQLHVQRVYRDDGMIGVLEQEVLMFLSAVDAVIDRLRRKFPHEPRASNAPSPETHIGTVPAGR